MLAPTPSYLNLWGRLRTNLKIQNVIFFSLLHILGLYCLLYLPYLIVFHTKTFLWDFAYILFAGFGVTGGAHRYWSHRTFKAKPPLQILMLIAFATAGQSKLLHWVRNHRVHHKFSDTDSDPYNISRGFFFSHVGWLVMKKHPDVIEQGRKMDFTDLTSNPYFAFFDKHFWGLQIFFAFVFPIWVPCYFWGETLFYSFVMCMIRLISLLNLTWSVNSVAHSFGQRPYEKNIRPVENKVLSILAFGEGWHNFHHKFPTDYRASEFGGSVFNMTTWILDAFGRIGWAYDFKTISPESIQNSIHKNGDGTHHSLINKCTDE